MDFDVADGEFFCLLGPSSSGKTTTLRAISGLEDLKDGEVWFDGQNVTEAAMKLGEAIYKANAEATGEADPEDHDEGPKGVDDDIVDADFEDLNDEDKRA